MKSTQSGGLFLLLLCAMLSLAWGVSIARTTPGAMTDFKAVYYGSRCLLQHVDPYQKREFLRVYLPEVGLQPADPLLARLLMRAITFCINLPTTMLLVAPLALLPLALASALWIAITAAALALGAWLQWRAASSRADGVSLALVCLLLLNTESLLVLGNTAGLVAGLCAIAAWCFLEERFAAIGIFCMAVGLVIKPQDACVVWLCLLLLGGSYRKRALQTVVVAAVLAVPAAIWVGQIAPRWATELRSNLAATSGRGDINDPGPTSLIRQTGQPIISLASVISVLEDEPRFYKPVTYLLCAPLLVVWAITTCKAHRSREIAWLGIATVIPLFLVVTYHRVYDAKLLLLTIPACALLWAEGGIIRWLSLALNTCAIAITGDITSIPIRELPERFGVVDGGFWARTAEAVLTRPIPVVLLGLGIFYLWVYVRHVRAQRDCSVPLTNGSNLRRPILPDRKQSETEVEALGEVH